MLSYTETKTLLPKMATVPSTDTTNIDLLMQFWMDSVRTMCNLRGGKWWFLETTETCLTNTSVDVQIPATIRKLMSVTVTVGTTVYTPTPVHDVGMWNRLLAANLGTSDKPMYWYRQGDALLFAPGPSTNTATVTMRGRLNIPDLIVSDYTTGTITSVTGAGAQTFPSVVGSGMTWTLPMAGRYLRITDSTSSALQKGDGRWYKIYRVDSATALSLNQPYEGTTLVGAAAAYTIGQMTPIPEAYQLAPLYRALALFNQIKDPLHPTIAQNWWRLYDGGQEAGLVDEPGGMVAQMLENENETAEGVYISPNAIGSLDVNNPPQQELSGFS